MRLFNALRGGDGESTDAIRQTTSLTMAYLLEQNRRFESYMRGKVEELEARVAAQQARTSVSVHNDPDADEATQSVASVVAPNETQPVAPTDRADILDFGSADFGPDEVEEFFKETVTPENEAIDSFQAELADVEIEVIATEESPSSGWTNWEAALIGTSDEPIKAKVVGPTDLPAEPGQAKDDLSDSLLPVWLQTNLGQQSAEKNEAGGSAMDVNNIPEEMTKPDSSEPMDEADRVSLEMATASVEESDVVDNEAETSIPLQVGPVEDWA